MSTGNQSLSNQNLFLKNTIPDPEKEETFTKTDPTPVQKYSIDDYGSLDQELEAIRTMKEVVPDYVPDIIDYGIEDGEVKEIEYEFIDGATAKEIMNGRTDEDWHITHEDYGELEEVVEKLHDNGLVHGDLNKDNIMYSEDGWTLIDPAGVMQNDADYEEAVNSDNNRLNRIKGYLSKSRHQPHF